MMAIFRFIVIALDIAFGGTMAMISMSVRYRKDTRDRAMMYAVLSMINILALLLIKK